MERQFAVTLLSNVTSFQENSMATFRTLLPKKIQLDGDWEVGLTEISFTKSWFNIPEDQEIFLYSTNSIVRAEAVKLPAGCYTKIDTLLAMINGKIDNFKDKVDVLPHFSFISHSRRVLLMLGRDKQGFKINVRMGSYLQEMLGFRVEDYRNHYAKHDGSFSPIETESKHDFSLITEADAFSIEATYPIDIRAGVHSLFVYSDLIQPNIVGDVYAQLLRSVRIPNDAKYGDQCVITYENPLFVRLLTNEFETIKIDIKDDSGSDINFQFGRIILMLTFRKWKSTI